MFSRLKVKIEVKYDKAELNTKKKTQIIIKLIKEMLIYNIFEYIRY